ncbi:endosomal peripheral membrane protein [Xylona heveae TC161]|uniref:Endosomal peripheral membrane protein n=1 Tax=Xylona heveae (strain CBS 132557 / TC161) TaxID=1328760 RepID=A0A165GKR6_XYLHT|nr:endosomal peripheral membrane protein [Xylona heveae TC161]KZF22311.1 endosomal peripheral membrane protein [Xylona heveae TC161]
MTAQILSSELSNLIQESKRKNSELRHAAEESLTQLKALPSTSETQLAADLSRRPDFINPFLIACATKNAKFSSIGVSCLQRLVVSRGLPRARLRDVLEALSESTSLGVEVQLKILQALPPLLQYFAEDLQGDLLGKALRICAALLNSKLGVVSSTSAATLQQLVVSVFDKVVTEDEKALQIPTTAEAPTADGSVPVRTAAFDAYRVFNDICLLTEGQKPQFLRSTTLPQSFGLELLESILANHAGLFLTHMEQANVLRTHLMPFIIKSLSERHSFPTTVRTIRILQILLKKHISILASECEMAFSLLTHMLEPDAAPLWKRAVCMEIIRDLHADSGLIRKIYQQYDESEGRKTILKDQLAVLVRLAAEKPNVIGLSHQSTMPAQGSGGKDASGEQVALEAGGVAGIIGGAVGVSDAHVSGISSQFSTLRVQCLDQLDKAEPPSLPDSYIYALALSCINSFSEGLARFILPLTIPDTRSKRRARPETPDADEQSPTADSEKPVRVALQRKFSRRHSHRRDQLPVNPVKLLDHPLYADIKTSAAIITDCWPAVLATCSTFLYAALDAEYYHNLVRAFQKFTHVAGLLELSTPRDAFLTTLGKAAVPSQILAANLSTTAPSTPTVESHGMFANAKGLLSVESLVSQSSGTSADRQRQPSVDAGTPTLTTRNLLCLRALLNLGIALGPILAQSWSIILETLQQADFILFASSRKGGRTIGPNQRVEVQTGNDTGNLLANFGGEITAVETAASRMFESTSEFPNNAFVGMLRALCKLAGDGSYEPARRLSKAPRNPESKSPDQELPHKRLPSLSGISTTAASQIQENHFALVKLGDLARVNMSRLIYHEAGESGWEVLVNQLVSVSSSTETDSSVRLRAADTLNQMVVIAATSSLVSQDVELRTSVQRRALSALKIGIASLYATNQEESVASSSVDDEIHRLALEALRSILADCGDPLAGGWDIAFDIVDSVFDIPQSSTHDDREETPITHKPSKSRSPKLVRSSFGSLEIICSDFLSSLPSTCDLVLIDTLFNFCSQADDLNISLTAVTYFWSLSDFLQGRNDSSFDDSVLKARRESEFIDQAKGNDPKASDAALWMLLLLRLTAVTTDRRPEVRNGAIQSLFRIFDVYGDRLSPLAWESCLRMTIFNMIEANLAQQNELGPSRSVPTQDEIAWNDTTKVMLDGISTLFSTYLAILVRQEGFALSWEILMGYLGAYLERQCLEISAKVFALLRDVIAKVENVEQIGASSVHLVWGLWTKGIPISKSAVKNSKSNNQDAYIAYVQLLKEIYRLIEADLDVERVREISNNLRECVWYSDTPAYTADIDYLTALQSHTLDCVRMIRKDVPGVPSIIISQLADFVSLPYIKPSPEPGSHELTFVALSKASMEILEACIIQHLQDQDIYTSGALLVSLSNLSMAINGKYLWRLEGKDPPTWKRATTATVSILESTLPLLPRILSDDEELKKLWNQVISTTDSIVAAESSQAPANTDLLADQNFDMEAFHRLRVLITPALGAATTIPDSTRRAYAESLFRNSIIHASDPWELPEPGTEPLSVLAKPRWGRTYDPHASPRSRMSYACLDELFGLVAVHDGSSNRIKLAQAAAPYLITRAGISLRAYLADQPLRGRMPQPASQRVELLYILSKLIDLDSEPKAIPEAPGVNSMHKKHLHRLFPLVSKAVGVASRDQGILAKLTQALDVVGEGFGV